jgi:hypothetical protein
MAERNMDWTRIVIPEDCKAISVFSDGGLFDEFVAVGLKPLFDGRDIPSFLPSGFQIPVFIGYEPGVAPQHLKHPDILDRLRAARSGEGHNSGCSDKNHGEDPSQESDSCQE